MNLSDKIINNVARTGKPHQFPNGWTLTIDDLIRATRASHWDGDFYQLTYSGLRRVTETLNQEKPWTKVAATAGEIIRNIAASTTGEHPVVK
jgi:hypothetical protein